MLCLNQNNERMTARKLTLELNSIKNDDEIIKLIQSFNLNSQEDIKTVIKENYNKIKQTRNNFANIKPRKTNDYIELLDILAMYEQKCALNYNEELDILLEILDIYRTNPTFMIKTDVFVRLGSVYNRLGEYQYEKYCYIEAEESYRYFFDDFKNKLPDNLSIFDHICKCLTWVYKNLFNEYQDNAKEFYEEALGVYEKFLPKNHITIAEILNGLAKFYSNIGEDLKKEDYCKKAIHYYELAFMETPLENDLYIADTCNNMGAVYYELNDYAKSKETYEKALDIYRKLSSKNQSLMNDIFIRLGSVYNCLGEYENEKYCYIEAEEIYKYLFDDFKNKLPDNLSIFDKICKCLTCLYRNLINEYQDNAKEFYEEALGIYERFLLEKQQLISEMPICLQNSLENKEVDYSTGKNQGKKNLQIFLRKNSLKLKNREI